MTYTNRGTPIEQPRSNWGDDRNYASDPGGSRSFGSKSSPSPDAESETRQPARGHRWLWDSRYGDYVREQDGQVLKYTEYQKGVANLETKSPSRPGTAQGLSPPSANLAGTTAYPADGDKQDTKDKAAELEQPHSPSPAVDAPPAQADVDDLPTRILKPYETPLDLRFRVVEKPKRFFAIGRIFKAVWFEPGPQQDLAAADPDKNWSAACPAFHEERPFAKFRWFVVVRKRLHHSLCFAITTFGGRAATKTSRGRARDFVVLYPHGIEPPEPWPEEGIERDPLAIIIEEGQQFLSPAARVDCGRIYTVEDNLRVMKIGRIHPDSLANLEECFRESVS